MGGQTSMIAQQRSWTMPNLCARRRSSERQAASGPSHPWTVSLMYVLQAKALLRRVRNCTVFSYCRAVLCKDIFSKAQVVDERLSTTNFGSCQRTLQAKIWCPHPTYVEFSGLLFQQFCRLISSAYLFNITVLGTASWQLMPQCSSLNS